MITIEGNGIIIVEMSPEKEVIEVADGKTLFKAKKFEVTCENQVEHGHFLSRNQKVTLYDYTAEPLPKGYLEKKAIEKGLDKINNGTYCMGMDEDFNECVNVIYETLIGEGVLK